MKMIKTALIIVITLVGLGYAFSGIIPFWLGSVMVIVGLIAIIGLNIYGLRMAGQIKNLSLIMDLIIVLNLLLIFIPWGASIATFIYYLTDGFFLAFTGLLIAILVKAYNTEIK